MQTGQNNLIPHQVRSGGEAREMGKKGGIASGKARREQGRLKRAMEAIMVLECPDEDLRAELAALGLPVTVEQALALSVMKRVIKTGDFRGLEFIMKVTGEMSDKETAQIERLEAVTERLRLEVDFLKAPEDKDQEGLRQFVRVLNTASMDGLWDDESLPSP